MVTKLLVGCDGLKPKVKKKKIITIPAYCPPPYYFVLPPFPFPISKSHDF